MIIRDKQDLRKCVKQSVRRAAVVETAAQQGVLSGGYGVANWLAKNHGQQGTLQDQFLALCCGSPFAAGHQELLAALDAMNLPVHDLDKAQTIIEGYDQDAYCAMALDALRARRVLVETGLDQLEAFAACDQRFKPLPVIEPAMFAPGRYGVDYAQCAQEICSALAHSGARDIKLAAFDADAIKYCLIPVCEDSMAVLHLHIENAAQWQLIKNLIQEHPQVCVLLSASSDMETHIIREAAGRSNLLVRIADEAHIPAALTQLGTRFVPFASHAATPEALLGCWIRIKETIWQAMCEAYLPLARTGYELTREQIERDAERLLGGNLLEFYE